MLRRADWREISEPIVSPRDGSGCDLRHSSWRGETSGRPSPSLFGVRAARRRFRHGPRQAPSGPPLAFTLPPAARLVLVLSVPASSHLSPAYCRLSPPSIVSDIVTPGKIAPWDSRADRSAMTGLVGGETGIMFGWRPVTGERRKPGEHHEETARWRAKTR